MTPLFHILLLPGKVFGKDRSNSTFAGSTFISSSTSVSKIAGNQLN